MATVLRNHPELGKQIVELIAVAGRRQGQRFQTVPEVRPFRDFNFEKDPQAFQVLIDAGVPLVLAPWELSSKVWLTEEDLAALDKVNGNRAWLVEAARDWLGFWKLQLKASGFNPFDTLAVGYAISNLDFKCDDVTVAIAVRMRKK